MSEDFTRKAYRNSLVSLMSKLLLSFFSIAGGFLLVRILNVEEFGQYSFVLGLMSLFGFFTSFGLGPYFTREMSREPQQVRIYVGRYLGVQCVLSSLSLLGIGVLIWGQSDPILRSGLWISGGALLVGTFFNPLSSPLVSIHRNDLVSYETLMQSLLQLLLTICGYFIKASLLFYFWVPLMAALLRLGLATRHNLEHRLLNFPSFRMNDLKEALKGGLPFGLLMGVNVLYVKIDVLLFKHFQGDYVTGLYAAAGKLGYLLVFIPGGLAENIYPIFSRRREGEQALYASFLEKFIFYSLLICVPIALAGAFESRFLTRLAFGERYDTAAVAMAMAVYLWLPVCCCVHSFTNLYLGSVHRVWFLVKIAVMACLINVALNVWWLAHHGGESAMVGSAGITVATEFLLACFSLGACRTAGALRLSRLGWNRMLLPLGAFSLLLAIPMGSFWLRGFLATTVYGVWVWHSCLDEQDRSLLREGLSSRLKLRRRQHA